MTEDIDTAKGQLAQAGRGIDGLKQELAKLMEQVVATQVSDDCRSCILRLTP